MRVQISLSGSVEFLTQGHLINEWGYSTTSYKIQQTYLSLFRNSLESLQKHEYPLCKIDAFEKNLPVQGPHRMGFVGFIIY